MNLFYETNILETLTLNEDESAHCSRVLRLKNNDIIFITDGKGNLYESEIVEINPKRTVINIINSIENFEKRNYSLHIAIAPTKNIDRIEWFVEKATEIGIDKISFLLCENSERKIIRTDRINKIVESAMKQSYKAFHPIISEMVKYENFVKNNNSKNKFIAHCENAEKQYLANIIEKSSEYLILIGPEGDFSKSEIELANSNGFQPISLGNSRLRTETAGIVACDIISIKNF